MTIFIMGPNRESEVLTHGCSKSPKRLLQVLALLFNRSGEVFKTGFFDPLSKQH